MWHGNPVLTAVMFGLPLVFLSLICHSICCADIMDADDDEEEGIEIHIFLYYYKIYHEHIQVQSDVMAREI
jgi:hypothetical protein